MKTDEFILAYGADYIRSRSNPKCVALSKLTDKKYRDESEMYLAEGVKLTTEAMRYAECDCVVVSSTAAEKNERAAECAKAAKEKNIRLIVCDDAVFEKISTEKAPQGVICAVKYQKKLHTSENFAEWQKNKRIVMLAEVRDPGNLGTIMRTAEALGNDGVVLAGCADIYNSKTVRAAMGTLFRLPVFIAKDAVECAGEMRSLGRRVIAAALDENSLKLGKYDVRESDCVIIGNEGHGLDKTIIDAAGCTVMIPMAGMTESLNASSAASCIMWEYYRAFN